MHITWDTFKKMFFCLNCLYHWHKVRGLQSTPKTRQSNTRLDEKCYLNTWKWTHLKNLKVIQITAIQSFWNVFKFSKIFPKMGFSPLIIQMKSKNFNFDRVWAMSIVKYIYFFNFNRKMTKNKLKSFSCNRLPRLF